MFHNIMCNIKGKQLRLIVFLINPHPPKPIEIIHILKQKTKQNFLSPFEIKSAKMVKTGDGVMSERLR